MNPCHNLTGAFIMRLFACIRLRSAVDVAVLKMTTGRKRIGGVRAVQKQVRRGEGELLGGGCADVEWMCMRGLADKSLHRVMF